MSALHPFSLLAIAAALPAFAWILPAPAGGLATTLIAMGLTLTPGASPGSTGAGSTPGWRPRSTGVWLTPGWRSGLVTFRTALVIAAPFWLFLRLLHDGPTTVAMGLRITTMVASCRGLGMGVRRTPLAAPLDRTAERVARWTLLLLCLAALIRRLA